MAYIVLSAQCLYFKVYHDINSNPYGMESTQGFPGTCPDLFMTQFDFLASRLSVPFFAEVGFG
jgi:hypothetical protein